MSGTVTLGEIDQGAADSSAVSLSVRSFWRYDSAARA